MRTCTLRCALITGGLLALASLSWAATGTAGAASPGSTASAASAAAAAGHPPAAAPKASAPKAAAAAPLIDINSANRKQLKTLPGLGDAEVQRLIAGRPYLSKAELVSKNVITTGAYLSIKHLIIAKQPVKAKAKGAG